jgi:acyl-CoA dehydrogenase
MGQNGANIYDIIFEDCPVPPENLIGGVEGKGFGTAMKTLDRGRIHVAAVCIGVAQRLVEESLRYAMERKQFGQEIANFQLVQAMLADSQTETYAARCMILDAARNYDDGIRDRGQAAQCKMYASEMVGRVADRAVQIHGGAGYVSEYAVERLYRDVRIFRIYEGTTQIQQTVIAKEMMRNFEG